MKRLFVLFFALALTVSLCACGAPKDSATDAVSATVDTEAIRETFDKATAYIDSNIDTSDMSMSTQDDSNGESLYRYWNGSGGKATFGNEIEIAGNTVEIGKTTVKDLESFDLDVTKTNDTVEPDENAAIELYKDNKTCILMTSDNLSGNTADIEDMTIGSVSAAFDEYALPFNYGGLNEKSTVSDVVALIGEPNNTVNLSVDETGAIITLSYSKTAEDASKTIDDNLSIFLYYDSDSDSAVVKSVQLNRSITE